ncbi:sugar ABC transporter permease [Cohnella faecalis]|uniref:Sugar ABC transporter permease n=1 Tax=Cohnella faecalis TaxID=2315694 RepID=A0A398CDZ2_9BACL|nr:sugar ABC transporter permease [Cohnella faecalis]
MMIDGAGKWKTFIHLTLPMIAPGITVNVLIGLANGLRIFDLPFALRRRAGRGERDAVGQNLPLRLLLDRAVPRAVGFVHFDADRARRYLLLHCAVQKIRKGTMGE